MSDPRTTTREQRSKQGPSELMKALRNPERDGDVVNFCPFGCGSHELDNHGYCAHLVGFTNGGTTYEPRELDQFGRIFTNGANRQPMKRGFKMVKITTSARVYSPESNADLSVEREYNDNDVARREEELLEAAESLRNPALDGEWSEPTVYGSPHEDDDRPKVKARKKSESQLTE